MPCYCSKCERKPDNNWKARTIKIHLEADKKSLGACSDVEKLHLHYCILRTSKFLETGQQQPEFAYKDESEEEEEEEVFADTVADEDANSTGNGEQDSGLMDLAQMSIGSYTLDNPNGTEEMELDAGNLNADPDYPHWHTDHPDADNPDADNPDTDDLASESSFEITSFPPGHNDPDTDSEDSTDISAEFQSFANDSSGSEINAEFFQTPKVVDELRRQLLGGYKPPDECPPGIKTGTDIDKLSPADKISLEHFIAWYEANGTVKSYNLHANVLAKYSGHEILSLYQARKLAEELTGFHAIKVDMCPKSCIAYTGKYEHLDKCPYKSSSGPICDTPRYRISKGIKKPNAQFQVLSPMDTIRALYANADTSAEMRNRDSCLRKVLHLVGTAANNAPTPVRTYSDYADGQIHQMQYEHLGLFKDPRDVAFSLSTDGAQLTMKKQSNTWLLILIILNLRAAIRYGGNVIISLATPGPHAPGDIESFLWIIFVEMAKASEGIWMYDALDSSYFLNRAVITMVLGDMLGAAKINGMAGHTAIFGDRFSMVQAARSSCAKGSKALYYPSNPPENSTYNPQRPNKYNLDNLPLRTQSQYWKIIQKLEDAKTKTDKANIVKATGVSRLPLCAASRAFIHPTYSPVDPFHIDYENQAPLFWDIWTTLSDKNDPVHFHNAAEFGALIPEAMKTLPPVFCGPVRDPYLKRQSQYKIYEWMALVHWYTVPIGMETSLNSSVLSNYSQFAEIIEFVMTNAKRTDAELTNLQELIVKFLKGFEKLYVGNNPEKIHRMRLCMFQLIHFPNHIRWNGSIRLGSQATVERSIGEMGKKIRSKKAPFANLANLIYEKELVKILCLYYPELDSNHKPKSNSEAVLQPIQQHRISKKNIPSDIKEELAVISALVGQAITSGGNLDVQRWGKLKLLNGHVLSSRSTEAKIQVQRQSFWFEAKNPQSSTSIFGEAVAFYQINLGSNQPSIFAVYKPIIDVKRTLNCLEGQWGTGKLAINANDIISLVGIWVGKSESVWILRKHPGLTMLTPEECGIEVSESGEPDMEEHE